MRTDVDPDPLLRILREYYKDRWSIRRTARLWIATAHDYTAQHAPTLIQEDVEMFVRELEHPPAGAGRAELLRRGGHQDGPQEG
ncbi:hypothetical protein [Nocardiopsis chromatogenes]|uniref:hypothetical protein n=1 Tax=Nocardiopsis chromatogenes TaxID=280239 RepID=UPI00034BB021|nr:hypothetical protein [Nocardiopsis chromatogenes]